MTLNVQICLFLMILFIYLFLTTLGLHCCVGFFLVALCGLLIAVASPDAEHRLYSARGLVVVSPGL